MANEYNSAKFLGSILAHAKSLERTVQIANKFDFSGVSIDKWKRNASYAIDLLESNNVEYCLIKAYDVPFALMEDVDILIDNPVHLIKIFNILKVRGFMFKHVPFNDRLKISAINRDLGTEIDFYPDSKWGQLRYAKKGMILSKRQRGTKHGINAPIPSPQDELLIIGSHAYNHGRITLLEATSASQILLHNSPDVTEILYIAKSYHLEGAISILLFASDRLLKSYGYTGVKDEILVNLENNIHHTFKRIPWEFGIARYPFRFPISSLLLSSLSKITSRGLTDSTPRWDELANFVLHNRFTTAFYDRIFPEYVDSNYLNMRMSSSA